MVGRGRESKFGFREGRWRKWSDLKRVRVGGCGVGGDGDGDEDGDEGEKVVGKR